MDIKCILIVSGIILLLIIIGLSIVNNSSEDLMDKFNQVSRFPVGTTPVEFASLINSIHFNSSIQIKYKDGVFSDAFNGNGTLTLSKKYASDNNLAGLAICAHELGHAFQFKEQKQLMKSHAKKIFMSKTICKFTTPFIVCGILAFIFNYLYLAILLGGLGVLCFILAVITKMSTLKIESGASKRALELLRVYASFTDEELKMAKTFLNSAKQTYLAEILRIVLKWTFLVKKR